MTTRRNSRFRRAATLAGASAAAIAASVAIFADAAYAQQAVVTGRVVDSNGDPLPGARVSIVELGLETATNRQGEFTLPAVEAGQITLEADYLGLPASRQTVTVAPSERARVVIVIEATGRDEIVVRGVISSGSARALNQQRTNLNTSNVVSADTIGRFPDSNAAEALQRVPGFGVERDQGEGRYINLRGAPSDFTAVTVDGVSLTSPSPDTRAIDLDTIPSDAVNAIEISKTLLPDQDADSIAGAVNLVTRSPFDRPGLRVSGQGGASYNGFGGTSDKRASGVISNTFGGDRFGALLSGSYSKTKRQVDNYESVWDVVETPEGDEIVTVVENEFKDYDTRRERIAVTGALEFRPTDRDSYALRGAWSRFTDDEFRNLIAIIYEDGAIEPGASEGRATWANTRFAKEFRNRVVRNDILTLSAGAEHERDAFKVDYTVSFVRSEQSYPRRAQLLFRSNVRPTLSYDYANPDNPVFSLFETGEHLDPANYDFREVTFRFQDTRDEEIAGGFNVEIPSRFAGSNTTFKLGGKFRFRNVEVDEERFRDRRGSSAPSMPLASLLGDEPSQNFDYFLGQKFNPDLATGYFDAIEATATEEGVRRFEQSTTADYQASENIVAGYAMATLDLGRADVVLGARVERTDFDGLAPRLNEDTGEVTMLDAGRTYTNVFHNATLRWELADNLIARAAATRGILRPRYRDAVPRVVDNTDGLGRVFVTRGNPDLKPTLSNNFDLGLEYYISAVGLISLNGFYKDIKDYQFTLASDGTFLGGPARITQPENAQDGRILGFEANWQQQLSFLPGFLSNFGVFANYTFTDAEMEVGDSVPGRTFFPLPGHSKHTYNLAGYYETDRFSVRLAYNKRSDYLQEVDANDERFDTYWEGRGQLDLTSTFDVAKNFQLFVEAKNLTNTPGVRYDGVRSRVQEYEKFGYSVFSGLRFNF